MPSFTITMKANGPYILSPEDAANLRLLDATGNPIPFPEGQVVKLCRCGGSSRKPFCDGQHSRIGFQGAIAAVESADSTATPPRSGEAPTA